MEGLSGEAVGTGRKGRGSEVEGVALWQGARRKEWLS